MKPATIARPISPATMLLWTESWPSVGPTVRFWTTLSGTGSAPDLSWMTMFCTSSSVKRPLMRPLPAQDRLWMIGDESTRLSSVIARYLPTFAWVKSPNAFAPSSLKEKSTSGRLVVWSKPTEAVERSLPWTTVLKVCARISGGSAALPGAAGRRAAPPRARC